MKSSETSPSMWRDEIGQEHERALEHGDQVQAVGEVAADLGGHLGDARLNLVGGEQDFRDGRQRRS